MLDIRLGVKTVQVLSVSSPNSNRVVSGNYHLGDNVVLDDLNFCYREYLGITFEDIPEQFKYRALPTYGYCQFSFLRDRASDFTTIEVYTGGMEDIYRERFTGTETFAELSLSRSGYSRFGSVNYQQGYATTYIYSPYAVLISGRTATFTPASSSLTLRLPDSDVKPEITGQPSKGFHSLRKPTDFSWTVYIPDCAARDEISVSGTKFRWRVKGASSYTEIDVGTNNSITISPNTFPLGQIEWQVYVQLNIGTSNSSSWYTITTEEALSTAAIIAPINTMVDGSAPLEFSWQHIISTSSEPTGADIEINTSGEWQMLTHIGGSQTSYTAPQYSFESGDLAWRVRTYNTDGAPGEFSEPANVVVIAAPLSPAVYATMTGRPLISWQSSDQQAYKVEIDGDEHVGFGLDKSYRWPHFLAPGIYTVKVYIQNAFGLWSEPGITEISVQAASGEPIVLSAATTAGLDVSLSWSSGYDSFVVLRNDIPIAVVSDNSYTDHYSTGSTSYKVYGLPSDDGNYVSSNEVTVFVSTDSTYIRSTDNGEWLALPYSDQQLDSATANLSATGSMRHFLGAEYPIAEVSSYREYDISLEFAVIDDDTRRKVQSLIGRQVCLKSRGEMCIGVLLDLTKSINLFYTRYALTLRRVHFDEEVRL